MSEGLVLRVLVATSLLVAVVFAGGGLYIARYLGSLDDGSGEAWALFEADRREPQGRNGYAALFCLAYDVPEDEWEAVLEDEVERVDAGAFGGERERPEATPRRLDGYRLLAPRDGEDPPLFAGSGFAELRARPDAYRRMYARDEPILERIARLGEYDYVRSAGPRSHVPNESLQGYLRAPTMRAYEFVSGRIDAALDGACRDISAARMLLRSGGELLVGLLGVRAAIQNVQVLGNALAEMPDSRALPPSCAVALVPTSEEERSHCPELHREIENLHALIDWVTPPKCAHGCVGLDLEKSKARLVSAYAKPCGEQAREDLAEDRRTDFTGPPDWLWRVSCIGNPIGCSIEMQLLIDIHARHGRSKQDVGALLRMLSAIVWLREHTREDEPWEARVAKLPDHFHTPSRAIRLGEDGASLVTERYEGPERGPLTLPLPGIRAASQTTSRPPDSR